MNHRERPSQSLLENTFYFSTKQKKLKSKVIVNQCESEMILLYMSFILWFQGGTCIFVHITTYHNSSFRTRELFCVQTGHSNHSPEIFKHVCCIARHNVLKRNCVTPFITFFNIVKFENALIKLHTTDVWRNDRITVLKCEFYVLSLNNHWALYTSDKLRE